jgi:hypothetical protein
VDLPSPPASCPHSFWASRADEPSRLFILSGKIMAKAISVKTPPAQIRGHLQTGVTRTIEVDAASLERELHSAIRGEVRFSAFDQNSLAIIFGRLFVGPF